MNSATGIGSLRGEVSSWKRVSLLLIRWAEIYANTEILSPIDSETWRVIAQAAMIGDSSRVVELASGKGAFANYLGKNFGCRVEGYDHNPEFVEYSNRRAAELRLESKVKFNETDVRRLEVARNVYDLGVCLGALYIFREDGWKVLIQGVKPGGFLAVSDLVCTNVPAPKEIMDVFFEEPGQPLTQADSRQWYTSRGVRIIEEVACSQEAWVRYYDLTKQALDQVSKRGGKELFAEIEEALREDRLVRQYRESFLDYITFIMQKV